MERLDRGIQHRTDNLLTELLGSKKPSTQYIQIQIYHFTLRNQSLSKIVTDMRY